MPDVIRTQTRFDCTGIHLASPIDRMPPGKFPYLFNCRVIEEGRIESRPGYTRLLQLADVPNSIRRLNDPSTGSYTYIAGGGGNLYSGQGPTMNVIDSGYSGDPLSLIPARPEGSPQSWMYVFDRNKSSKVSSAGGQSKAVGVTPPTQAPLADYGVPHTVDIATGQSTVGWAAGGTATGPGLAGRTGGTTAIAFIIYDSSGPGGVGPPGWACMRPSTAPNIPWAGERMKVILNQGGANQEEVVIREIHPPITATTLAGIAYDSGSTGLCSVILAGNPSGLERNSMIQIGGEAVRVLEVVPPPGGSASYSIRCSTGITHGVGEPVIGLTSWYLYTALSHQSGESITASYLVAGQTTGDGILDYTFPNPLDASNAQGRLIDPANDYLHISLYFTDPTLVTNVQLMLCYDAAPNFSFTSPGNASIFKLTPTQFAAGGAQGWVEIVIPISSGTRTGSNFLRGLATLTGIAIDVTSTATTSWGFDWWYLFGTYGPTIVPNSPVGMVYAYRYRDSSTNAHSVPSPVTRYQLFPLREAVELQAPPPYPAGIDSVDFYRQGGAVTSLLYVGTASPPNSIYEDTLTDTAVLSINQAPDLGALPPWPILQPPWTGTVNVVGTSVTWASGQQFNTALVPGTVITINGVAYQTSGPPSSATQLQLTQSAGVGTNVPYAITSPTLVGQALAYVFGPLEGPFAPVLFGLGDPKNGGNLYFSNFSDFDSAADSNFMELCPPSNDLVSGTVHAGVAYAGNRDQLFSVRFSYLTEIGATPTNNQFQWYQVPVPSGIWSRWACCDTPLGVAYLGRDGIYIASENGAVNITDEDLYPLFPHDGQPAKTVQWGDGSSTVPPVDMTRLTMLRLSYCDEAIRFSFVDTGGNYNTLIYEIYRKRWFLNHYGNAISYHYLVEASAAAPNDMEILSLALDTRSIVKHGGDVDGMFPINVVILTPSDDGKDERMQKLYVDLMIQADGQGSFTVAATYDNSISFGQPNTIAVSAFVAQFIPLNLSSQSDLTLHRNIGTKYAWTGGPDGVRLYAWESSGFIQPYLSKFFVTQIGALSFPGWKHIRRVYPALISLAPVVMSYLCQDGRVFGPYVIPSTNGRYRQLPFMVNHALKDLALSLQLDGQGSSFAFFPGDFVAETKEWSEQTYIKLAQFRA